MGKAYRVLLGVTGGIAAYKSAELVRLFRKAGHDVQVVMTAHARRLVGPETFAALSGRQVATELFPRKRPDRSGTRSPLAHVDLASWADLVLVAPATANIIGKLASGIADDLLSTMVLAVPESTLRNGRVILAPAMNANMWLHPSVQANVARLAKLGYVIAGPDRGQLACGMSGPGRMIEPTAIFDICQAALSEAGSLPDLTGIRVLVTAGRTEEPLDPVRVITNRSTGQLGVALCRQFTLSRAQVRLIAGAVSIPLPTDIETEQVRTTEEMLRAVMARLSDTDLLVMCAAPADYRPARVRSKKFHAAKLTLELRRTPDILKTVSAARPRPVLVGFSLDPSTARAQQKLEEKGLDLVVVNGYSTPGSDTITARLVPRQSRTIVLPAMTKEAFARRLVKEVATLLRRRNH